MTFQKVKRPEEVGQYLKNPIVVDDLYFAIVEDERTNEIAISMEARKNGLRPMLLSTGMAQTMIDALQDVLKTIREKVHN